MSTVAGLDPRQLRDLVVAPALAHVGLYSLAAEQLVMGTAAQESRLRFIKQTGGGPALGLWQMEPATERDLWDNYLAYQPDLAAGLRKLLGDWPSPRTEALVGNLYYAAAMCRVHYRRVKAPLPAAGDVEAMARYWKNFYNTALGKGRPEEFVANWRLVAGLYP